jgi:5-methylcytosine-specific restriction protein B
MGLFAGDEAVQGSPEDRHLDVTELTPHELGIEPIVSHLIQVKPRYQELTRGVDENDEAPEHQPIFDEIEDHLTVKGQLILSGPPGTGKTYMAQQFAQWWLRDQTNGPVTEGQLRTVTFHPSFSYEDFLEGLTAKPKDKGLSYEIEDGILKQIADEARQAYDKAGENEEASPYVLIVDEINRGNLPRILGETVTLLEFDKRLDRENETSIQLAHSGEAFTLPPNLYIIGTMNTADRSIALIDAAIQRRFRTIHFPPDYEVLLDEFGFESQADAEEAAQREEDRAGALQALSILALERINERIRQAGSLGKGKQIGHAYLLGETQLDYLVDKWRNDIFPLLEDYYFGQTARLREDIFDGGGEKLFDWELEQVRDFDADDLIETFRDLLGLHPESDATEG